MKKHVDLFKHSVGNALIGAVTIDPSLRRSPVRGAVVVGFAFAFGALVVVTAVAYKNMTVFRNLLNGPKAA
jgi:hypothetical protein